MNDTRQPPGSRHLDGSTAQDPEGELLSGEPQEAAAVERALLDLCQAWKRLKLYPAGHPSRDQVVRRAWSSLDDATADGDLVLGVEREGFLLGESHLGGPALEDLVRLLYRNNVAVLRVTRPVLEEELERFLGALGVEGGAADEAVRPAPGAALQFGTIVLEHADYASLVATDLDDDTSSSEGLSIWDRLLRLQMDKIQLLGDLGSQGTGGLQQALQRILAGLPREILRLENENPPDDLLQLIDLVAVAIREHTLDAVERRQLLPLTEVDELLDALPQSVALRALEGALTEFMEDESRLLHFKALLGALEPRRVLRALRRLRDRGLRFSERAVAEVGTLWFRTGDERARQADVAAARASLLEQLAQVDTVGRDGLRVPPTDELITLLAEPTDLESGGWTQHLEAVRPTLDPAHQKLALLSALTEHLGEPSEIPLSAVSDRIVLLVGDLIEADHPMAVVAVLQRLADARARSTPRRQEAFDTLRAELCGRSTARRIVHDLAGADDRRRGSLHTLVSALGTSMVEELVDYLAEEDDRSSRHRLLDFLASFRSDMIPAARKRLLDPRWFVVRNMIVLLDEIDDRTSLPMLRQCALHADLRVRAAALRVLGRIDRNLPEDLVAAVLEHDDASFVERSLHLLGRVRCTNAVTPMCGLLSEKGRPRSTRLRAIEALGMIGDPRALATVRQLLGTLSLVPAEERRAVFLSLTGYPPDEAVQALLAKGAKARDSEVRRHCQQALNRLAAGEGGDA